jgi:tripartite-type tricarboxylate transporter receptor subunit TctC
MDSPLRSMKDVIEQSRARPLVFAINGVGSVAFVSASLTSHLLDLPIKIVAGYPGSRAGILAALRGEVDLITYNLESLIGSIRNGDIRPLLQISDKRLSSHRAFDDVSLLGGPDGLAAAHARCIHQDSGAAQIEAAAVASMVGAGRIVVAPPGLDRPLSACLSKTVLRVMASDDLRSVAEAANVSLDIADGETAMAEFAGLDQKIGRFIPIIQSAIERTRQ